MTGKERRKQWRPSDPDGQPCVLPHDFGLKDAAALARLEVRKDEWIGVYQNGGYPPYGELLYASRSPKGLCRKLKRRRGVTWPISARLATTKEELSAPVAQSPQKPRDWLEELKRARNMNDGVGFLMFEIDGPGAWDAVRQLAQTSDAVERENRINSLWRMYPETARKLGLPKQPASSPSRADATKKEQGGSPPSHTVALTDREKKILEVIERGPQVPKGRMYCRELDNAGIAPRRNGVWKDCPRTYTAAYDLQDRGRYPWRHRIEDEKSKIRRKAGKLAGALASE